MSPDTVAGLPPLPADRPAFSGRWLTAAQDMAPFLTDWRRRWSGSAIAVAQPEGTADVAAIVRWCVRHRIAVVPQGGNTGLSGGSVPDASGRAVVLSLARMTRVRAIDPDNDTLTLEAGCTLLQAQEAAAGAGRLLPLSLAAEGSCTIGGNLATNAGGVQVLRYGNARELCLGLEVVLPDGQVWDGLRGLRKDNTGYDLRDLFIGSEGTLGVITAAVFKLYPQPAERANAWVAVPDAAAATALLRLARAHAGDGLTAFELISHTCLGLVLRHMPGTRSPLGAASPWYVLLELAAPASAAPPAQTLEHLLEQAFADGLASDAAVAASGAQFDALWALRENISEAQAAEGKTIKHDIALPISAIAGFVEETGEAIAQQFPAARQVVFGHLGDGNLHYNLSPAEGVHAADAAAQAAFLADEPALNRLVHDAVARRGGSISAEHGLGVLRRDEAARYKSAAERSLMQAVKRAIDPLGLFNPGKLLPGPQGVAAEAAP
ncbi:MAG: FAD-binding oxidoreductase [Burkholderiaceae bacterium]|nr:FAD-binding oxidoreductase [Burkholderiaceae bacterium]